MQKFLSSKNVLILIIVVGLLSKLWALAITPEAAYNDSLYHLSIVKEILDQKTLSLPEIDVPPPLYYAFFASALILSQLSLTLFTSKMVPLVLSLVQLSLAFVVFRKLFPQHYLAALAFFVSVPWLTRFGAVNYTEAISVVFVFSSMFLIMKLQEKKQTFFSAIPLAVSISALSLSKLNATLLVPVFFLASIYVLWKQHTSLKTVAGFIVITVFLSGFWFGLNILKFGTLDQHNFQLASNELTLGIDTAFPLSHLISFPHLYYLYFWDFPNLSAFSAQSFVSGIPFELAAVVFALMVLPLGITLLNGAKQLIQKPALLSFIVLLPIALEFIPIIQRAAYFRMIIPVVPLIAVVFAFGFAALSNKFFKSLVILSLLLFSFYSLAYTGTSALFFKDVFEKHLPLYNAISETPQNSLVLVYSNNTRAVSFFSSRNPFGFNDNDARFESNNASEFLSKVKQFNITHIAQTCYKSPLNKKFLNELEQQGLVKEIFSDSCAKLYEVK